MLLEPSLYILSKLAWGIIQPEHSLMLLLSAGAGLLLTRWHRLGLVFVVLASALISSVALFPTGRWLLLPLEDRFPPLVELPVQVDGIIILGGGGVPSPASRDGAESFPEDFVAFADLARRYPRARLVFAGGGPLGDDGAYREADAARETFDAMGLDMTRLMVDRNSRNTYENAVQARAIAAPSRLGNWILVTAAAHMPRSVGLFRGQWWNVIPDPVDFRTRSDRGEGGSALGFSVNLEWTSLALKEWLGMLANCCLGRSPTCFPAPDPDRSSRRE
jgi:uncharacterized SAM-binding protein YcdF (DUF218 family)